MDTDNYENPFASSEKEIGQMDVQIDDIINLRETIRGMILEANDFGCNKHSLGFIDDKGKFIDLTESDQDHLEYLGSIYGMDAPNDCPNGWIKVSNANNIFYTGGYWTEATEAQIDGLIEMWIACKKYSRWIDNDVENFYVNFGCQDEDGESWDMTEQTIVEFLEMYGYRGQLDKFFGMLLGEL